MRSLRGYGSILSAPNREMQAGMAQSVERHIGSVEVPGPIPGASSQKKADRNCGPSFVLPFCSVSLQGGRGSICFSAKQRAGLSPDLETDLPAFCFLCFPSARPSPSLTPTSRCRTNAGPGKQVPARNPLSACHCLNYLLQPSRCAWQHRADPSKQAPKAVSENGQLQEILEGSPGGKFPLYRKSRFRAGNHSEAESAFIRTSLLPRPPPGRATPHRPAQRQPLRGSPYSLSPSGASRAGRCGSALPCDAGRPAGS